MINPYASRTNEKMKEVLMSPEALGPEVHYYMIRGGTDKKNITVWESGTVGGEYIKTYGHYHIIDFKETYWIIEGEGILLLQTRQKPYERNFLNSIETYSLITTFLTANVGIMMFTEDLREYSFNFLLFIITLNIGFGQGGKNDQFSGFFEKKPEEKAG